MNIYWEYNVCQGLYTIIWNYNLFKIFRCQDISLLLNGTQYITVVCLVCMELIQQVLNHYVPLLQQSATAVSFI